MYHWHSRSLTLQGHRKHRAGDKGKWADPNGWRSSHFDANNGVVAEKYAGYGTRRTGWGFSVSAGRLAATLGRCSMHMTRRAFGLGSIALGVARPDLGVAEAAPPSGARLQAALNACLADNPARAAFSVSGFHAAGKSLPGRIDLAATVALDWAPGMRLKTFRGSGDTPHAAFADLYRTAAGAFTKVVPGFVAASDAV
jgi:hypothetical protein